MSEVVCSQPYLFSYYIEETSKNQYAAIDGQAFFILDKFQIEKRYLNYDKAFWYIQKNETRHSLIIEIKIRKKLFPEDYTFDKFFATSANGDIYDNVVYTR